MLGHSAKKVSFQPLAESKDLECKLAAGPDGKGHLPKDFWATYSAFANTRGGFIILGVKEKSGRFEVHGVQNPERIISDLFNTRNNPQKVSVNVLTEAHIRQRSVDGKALTEKLDPCIRREDRKWRI